MQVLCPREGSQYTLNIIPRNRRILLRQNKDFERETHAVTSIKRNHKTFYTLAKQSALVCYRIEPLFGKNNSLTADI